MEIQKGIKKTAKKIGNSDDTIMSDATKRDEMKGDSKNKETKEEEKKGENDDTPQVNSEMTSPTSKKKDEGYQTGDGYTVISDVTKRNQDDKWRTEEKTEKQRRDKGNHKSKIKNPYNKGTNTQKTPTTYANAVNNTGMKESKVSETQDEEYTGTKKHHIRLKFNFTGKKVEGTKICTENKYCMKLYNVLKKSILKLQLVHGMRTAHMDQ